MRLWLELPDGSRRPLNSKGAFTVPPGGRLVMEAPGSGGYGPPSARDPALLREDRADGYVTETAAGRDYGIVDSLPRGEIREKIATQPGSSTKTYPARA